MHTGSVLFVVREADGGRRGRLERRCTEAAVRHGYEPRLLESPQGAEDWRERIVTAVARAVADGVRLVVAVGGDGTVGATAHSLAGTEAALAVVPTGAANLFARALRVPFEFDAALSTAFLGSEREVDLAFVDGKAVVAMAGIGVDAAVVAATTSAAKEVLGWPGYGLATVSHLSGRAHHFEVQFDDGSTVAAEAQSVVVANVGTLPAGLALSPRVRVDDGLLDVAILAPRGPLGWAVLLSDMFRAGRLGIASARLAPRQTRAVTVSTESELPMQLDGEPIPPGRELAARIAEGALTTRVPRTRQARSAPRPLPAPRLR